MTTSRPVASRPPADKLWPVDAAVNIHGVDADQAALRVRRAYYWIDRCRSVLGVQTSGHTRSTIDAVNREDQPVAQS